MTIAVRRTGQGTLQKRVASLPLPQVFVSRDRLTSIFFFGVTMFARFGETKWLSVRETSGSPHLRVEDHRHPRCTTFCAS